MIPTWNNLEYLKLCVASIRAHSRFQHQLLVHINEGSDGSLAWVQSQGDVAYTYSESNIGICHALNQLAALANTPYIAYFNDDMYALPDWDLALWKEIQALDHDYFFLSATMLEPFDSKNAAVISNQFFGTSHAQFDKEGLLNSYMQAKKSDWSGATWPPNVVSKRLWDAVGGYSEAFSPGLYSDPDFSMKLWQQGVRFFKGVAASRVYHFGSKSLKRIVLNDGRTTFMKKWGISPGFFDKYYLKKGAEWKGALTHNIPQLKRLFNKISVQIRLLLK
jgi:GT2 family glycosyltransferase